MPVKFPCSKYRPTRAADGEGGFTETLGSASTLYGATKTHNNRVLFICDMHEDVEVGDLIVIESARYRVADVERTQGTRQKQCGLERVDRPIVP